MNDSAVHKPRVSIVIATYDRCERLRGCIEAIRRNVQVDHEVIVVGGGAGDGTEQWLDAQDDVRFIRELRREGATRAYNKGFRAAAGTYVMWLNDDARVLPGAVEAALAVSPALEAPAELGADMRRAFDEARAARGGRALGVEVRGPPELSASGETQVEVAAVQAPAGLVAALRLSVTTAQGTSRWSRRLEGPGPASVTIPAAVVPTEERGRESQSEFSRAAAHGATRKTHGPAQADIRRCPFIY